MSARLASLTVAGLLSLGAVPAAAQAPAGSASYKLSGGLATSKMRYFAPAQQVVLRGWVKPAVPGEVLTLYALRGNEATKKIRRKVGNGGRFEFKFKVGNPGRLRLVIKHAASPAQAAFQTQAKRISVVSWQAGVNQKGVKVLLLQRALLREGYATPVTGYYDDATARGVLAFRKANNLGREGYASKPVFARLFRGEGAFELRYPKAGKHVEFDWSRQVLVLAKGGKPYRTYHTSSGTPATPTVFGTFRFYLQTPGTNSHGMVHSSYFIRGYAIHGYASVPSYPASHGCLRVPIPNALQIFKWIDVGDKIFSYR
jgi:L,D-transpeptidase catalytic domain/Putative peptidoglycan binding domain